nr:FCD domain-containing protein [Paracoccus saliphilus]
MQLSVDTIRPAGRSERTVDPHDFMASGLDNPFLQQAYVTNRNRIAIIQNARSFLADRVVPAMREHLEIIAALESGDSDAVVDRIEHHLKLTLRWWGV